ncbi:amidase [Acidisphaera sp. L21]|uniref:amidase n=1 Tax=Acidisphaera sp. L21 TaxID=1641851 RepID=UPI00131B58CB|nr:amidase [Acidisphaera sp. L21]
MTPPPVPGLAEASREIAAGHLSPGDLLDATLARIQALDPALHAFIEITGDRARTAARKAEQEIHDGVARGPLHGIPYGLKDLYDAAGLRTTCHSRVLLQNMAMTDSDATTKLDGAGMMLMGKLSTHEFAIGAPNPDLPFPCACNPWNVEHFAGGSSSGSGAAVASGMLPLAMGTDTGGSIRLPAAYTGIVGLKPTYGRLSRFGVVPLAFSMDHAGPLTRTVEDCALAMQALAGYDPRDPGSADIPVPDYLAELKAGVKGLRIGYARAFNAEAGVDAEESAALDAAAEVLRGLGAEVEEVVLPSRARFNAAGWTVIQSESFAVHARDLRTRPHDYARTTRERILLGAFVTGQEYVQAQRLRRVIALEVDRLLQDYDALIVAPFTGAAPKLTAVEHTPLRRDQPLTVLQNVTGHPALCQPCGMSANGLPLSLQLMGRQFGEAGLMRIAYAYEQAAGWHEKRPPV